MIFAQISDSVKHMSKSSKTTFVGIRLPNALLQRIRDNANGGNVSKTVVALLDGAGLFLPPDVMREVNRRAVLADASPRVLIAEALREHWYLVEPDGD